MTSINQKHQILESLNLLDQTQAEQVLAYIKNLITPIEMVRHQKLKNEALKEIRQALGKGHKLNPVF